MHITYMWGAAMVWAHLHNLPFKEGCAGSWWGVDGKGWGGEVGACTKCPLCSPRIGKMPCRAYCVCVFVWTCVCMCECARERLCVCECLSMCVCVWEPHLSGEPEGSNETTIMSVYMPIFVHVFVCVWGRYSRRDFIKTDKSIKICEPYQSFMS